jgi:hypothetical protein
MDAKINGIQQFIKKEVPEGARWSAYHRMFEQYFYVPSLTEQTKVADYIDKDVLEDE